MNDTNAESDFQQGDELKPGFTKTHPNLDRLILDKGVNEAARLLGYSPSSIYSSGMKDGVRLSIEIAAGALRKQPQYFLVRVPQDTLAAFKAVTGGLNGLSITELDEG